MTVTFLGIDVGTTNLKICVIDKAGKVLYEKSKSHDSFVITNVGQHEQDSRKILQRLWDLLREANSNNLLKSVQRITVTGQMHGIVFWNSKLDFWSCKSHDYSNLITWMDQRCDSKFLESLPIWRKRDGAKLAFVATGYGIATLLWLQRNGMLQSNWDCCGSIMDLVGFVLGCKSSVMSDQVAYSWGFVTEDMEWQQDIVDMLPHSLSLPVIKPAGEYSNLKDCNEYFTSGVRLYVPIGDLQATLYGFVSDKCAVMHLGTSAQVAFCSKTCDIPPEYNHLLEVPYFDGYKLIVAASLNGGNAIDNFVHVISRYHDQLFGKTTSSLNQKALNECLTVSSQDSDIEIQPLFLGERHSSTGAQITNLRADTSLEACLTAIRKGVVVNLEKMLPVKLLSDSGISSMTLLNRAASDEVCFESATEVFAPLRVTRNDDNVSAAFGAAQSCLR
ncbi:unnamed protein product [Bursaphelenchus okinawaensis]|uniref:Carbohydrate kinase FGGY N-terminal domain-containing protein n=1 Tax=Bursaphelenchus okinawaensis TaxID=465554 RepID=A0A811KJ89_9BILA|nr:unnamed protein product [Bursaphelenchus okinawaensis]CAG9103667.1 unnamed protein product [Bursaphelenchus okinawaensis]